MEDEMKADQGEMWRHSQRQRWRMEEIIHFSGLISSRGKNNTAVGFFLEEYLQGIYFDLYISQYFALRIVSSSWNVLPL